MAPANPIGAAPGLPQEHQLGGDQDVDDPAPLGVGASPDWLPPEVGSASPTASAVGHRRFSTSVQRLTSSDVAATGIPVLVAPAEHDQPHERQHRDVLDNDQ